MPDTIASEIEDYLSSLTESVQEYFPNLHSKTNSWVQNLFKITEMPMELTASDYESLIELTFDSVLKAKFEEVSIALFWGNLVEVGYMRIYQKKLLKSCYRLRRLTTINTIIQLIKEPSDAQPCKATCIYHKLDNCRGASSFGIWPGLV